MCYVEQIDIELWMVEEVVALNEGLHSRTVEVILQAIKELSKRCNSCQMVNLDDEQR
jgi:hypothetical protein